jgi:DnaJ-domain-containing protein 1
MKPLSVDAIARAWQDHGNAEGAAKALGISRRTLFYRLARASKAELKAAFEHLLREQHWAVQRLQERIGQLEHVEREYTALERWNRELAAENRQLHEMLAQAIDTQVRAIVDGTPAPMGQDSYAILGVTQTAPLEVIEAAYKALARKYHPDMGGSNAAMQRINHAYDEVRRRNGRLH